MATRNELSRRVGRRYGLAVFCCVTLLSGAASAAVSWKRVGTVTTLTNNQMWANIPDLTSLVKSR